MRRRQRLLPVLVLCVVPWTLLQLLSNPSCRGSGKQSPRQEAPRLTAMVVGDLHLAGPRTMWIDRVRREAFMSSSFKRAHEMLRPHALIVLGDVSDGGRKSSEEEWGMVVGRFRAMVGPYMEKHVTAGNHDVGDCHQVTPERVQQFAGSFPGVDGTGSEAFTIRGVPFVSLNAMALACDPPGGSRSLRSSVLGLVEHVRNSSHPRPVLLLHLPLFRADDTACARVDVPACAAWHDVEGGCSRFLQLPPRTSFRPNPYRSMIDVLSPNMSLYLSSALNPRLVLSAHTHRFCDRSAHGAEPREVTVSTFTWRNRDDPSFLLVHFYEDGDTGIQQCFLPRESLVLGLQSLQVFALLVLVASLMGGRWYRMVRKKSRLKA